MNRSFILFVSFLASLYVSPTFALPFARKVVIESIEQITRAASKETSESAAKKAAKEVAKRLGKEVPEIKGLLAKYGDEIGVVFRNPQRKKLFVEFGDDAAEALIKNGDAAESVLTRIPSANMAKSLRNLNRKEVRQLDALVKKGQITPENSAAWINAIQGLGTGCVRLVSQHPKLAKICLWAAGAGVVGYTFWDVFCFIWKLLGFIYKHPVETGFLVLLVLGLMHLLLKSPFALLRRIAGRFAGSIWGKAIAFTRKIRFRAKRDASKNNQ